MKYKKYSYLIALILMLLVGINSVYAETSKQCFYVSDKNDLRVIITLKNYGNDDNSPWFAFMDDYIYSKVNKIGIEPLDEKISIENDFSTSKVCSKDNENCITLNPYYESFDKFYKTKEPNCPKYIVLKRYNYNINLFGWKPKNYNAYLTDSLIVAQTAKENADSLDNTYAEYAELQPNMTAEEYYLEFKGNVDEDDEPISKDEFCGSLFGDPNDAGNEGTGEPPSLAYIINQIMDVVRIVVPILIVVLGILDFGKAVIASKEDEMKKTQSTFIKRLLIGVAVFFVPLLVNVVMSLADIVWENTGYSHCEVSEHLK